MSAFTPGPWVIVSDREPGNIYYGVRLGGPDDLNARDVWVSARGDFGEQIGQSLANAALIAAAPRLYDSLDLLLQEARRVNWASKFNGDVGVLEFAETSLRMARGEE